MKIQTSEWEKIIVNEATDKTYKQYIQLNIRKKKRQPNQNMGRRLKQTFLQRTNPDS